MKKYILSKCQYDLDTLCLLTWALMYLVEIYVSIEKKKYVMAILIDLKTAFDTTDHNILLNKLYHYGVRSITYDYVNSYLKNRT